MPAEPENCEPEFSVARIRSPSQVSISYHGEPISVKLAEPDELQKVSYRNVKLFLVTISMATFASTEATMWSFLATVLQYDSGLFAEHAAQVLSIIAGTFTIGKLFGIVSSIYFSPDNILIVNHGICLISMTTFYIWRYNVTIIYISAIGIGFGISSMWSSLWSLAHRYIGLTNTICSIFSVTVGFLTLITPIIIGPYLKTNPISYYIATFAGQLCSAITFAALKYLVSFVS